MLFPQEQTEEVKQWLITELEPLCDADPDVLADYVLALFKYDTGEQELLKMMNEQLVDFLEGETPAFVEKAYNTLKSGSYRSEAPKRSVEDTEDVELTDAEAPAKRQAFVEEPVPASADGQFADEMPENPEGMPMSDAPIQSRARKSSRPSIPKGLCRDYHSMSLINSHAAQGYCSRGGNCKFGHSEDSIVGPMPTPPPLPSPDVPWGPDQMAMAMEHMHQMIASGQIPEGMPMPPMPPLPAMPPMLAMRGTRGGMRGRGSRGRGGRGGFSQRAMPPARSQDTLVVENIPKENLNLANVNDYFKRFGTITNIDVDDANKRAVVTYASHQQAEAAHKSPEVIFGNRFVKVYFQRLEPQERPMKSLPSKTHYMKDEGSNKYIAPSLRTDSQEDHHAQAGDVERRKLLELRKKKQTLLNMQIAEQKSLLGKLESKDLTAQGRKSIMAMLEKLSGEIQAATEVLKKDLQPQDNATTEQLQAKLASLRQEAASLGLDASGNTRGRGRGRGASFRGRGAFPFSNRSFSLDNRTTRIGLSQVPSNYDLSQLKSHLEQYGRLQSLDRDGDRLIAHYETRADGEKAMRGGVQLPDVGRVPLEWVQTPSTTADWNATSNTHDSLDQNHSEIQTENWKR
ncbi:hypothetical protein MYAM1_002704 [Malassezia yamatoensis]|uniref:Uncharacterized protein n=1 Tax=Malassezia yamatoensis TaxID=253288 RepID=A0AAJ6CIL2_9BASI|nr:hypothetical protein MYAM1_002704 [Malassezia yamatoensis]